MLLSSNATDAFSLASVSKSWAEARRTCDVSLFWRTLLCNRFPLIRGVFERAWRSIWPPHCPHWAMPDVYRQHLRLMRSPKSLVTAELDLPWAFHECRKLHGSRGAMMSAADLRVMSHGPCYAYTVEVRYDGALLASWSGALDNEVGPHRPEVADVVAAEEPADAAKRRALLEGIRLPELRAACTELGVDPNGRKAEVVSRLLELGPLPEAMPNVTLLDLTVHDREAWDELFDSKLRPGGSTIPAIADARNEWAKVRVLMYVTSGASLLSAKLIDETLDAQAAVCFGEFEREVLAVTPLRSLPAHWKLAEDDEDYDELRHIVEEETDLYQEVGLYLSLDTSDADIDGGDGGPPVGPPTEAYLHQRPAAYWDALKAGKMSIRHQRFVRDGTHAVLANTSGDLAPYEVAVINEAILANEAAQGDDDDAIHPMHASRSPGANFHGPPPGFISWDDDLPPEEAAGLVPAGPMHVQFHPGGLAMGVFYGGGPG